MDINLGENIKRFRKQKDITQEGLADFIGVSFQSVSKWERNEGYPDITSLPAIANFFEVTLDELLGMDTIRNQAKIDAFIGKMQDNYSKGLIAENIELMREALRQFPSNYVFLSELALMLMMLQTTGDPTKNLNEAISVSKRILDNCLDDEIRYTVKSNLCYIYDHNSQNDEAIKLAKELPPFWKCKEITLVGILKGEEKIKLAQQNMQALAESFGLQIDILADPDYRFGVELPVQDRISILDKMNKVYQIVYDKGDYLYYNVRLAHNYRRMAALALLDVQKEQALNFLEKAVEHTIIFDALPNESNHTSLLVDKQQHNTTNTTKNYIHNESYLLLNDRLVQEKYDLIRETYSFKAMLTKLKQSAK